MGLRLGPDVLSGNREFADTTKINDGQWHHVAVVIAMGQSIQFLCGRRLEFTSSGADPA